MSGERDQETEVVNDVMNTKWNQAGIFDDKSGLFYIREKEHI